MQPSYLKVDHLPFRSFFLNTSLIIMLTFVPWGHKNRALNASEPRFTRTFVDDSLEDV